MVKVVAASVFALILCWLVWRSGRPSPASPKQEKSAPAEAKVLKVPNDLDWGSLSEGSLRDMTHQNEGPKKSVNADFDTLVTIGETVVTEGHEPSPGIFVFSTITPSRGTGVDGQANIQFHLQTTEIEFGGSIKTTKKNKLTMPKGGGDMILINLTSGRTYDTDLSATLDKTHPDVLHLRSRESSKPNAF